MAYKADETQRMSSLLEHRLSSGIKESVEWFHKHMAPYYFPVTSRKEQFRHLEFVHALRSAEEIPLTMIDDRELQRSFSLLIRKPIAYAMSCTCLGIAIYSY